MAGNFLPAQLIMGKQNCAIPNTIVPLETVLTISESFTSFICLNNFAHIKISLHFIFTSVDLSLSVIKF